MGMCVSCVLSGIGLWSDSESVSGWSCRGSDVGWRWGRGRGGVGEGWRRRVGKGTRLVRLAQAPANSFINGV